MFDFDVRSGHDLAEPEMLANLSRIRALGDDLSEPIARIARRPSVVVSPTTALRDASRLMTEQGVCAGLVASHGILLGTLSEREIIRRLLADPPATGESPVWKVMVADPGTLLENDTVAYTVRKMRTLGVRAMPVVRPNGSLGGLLDTHDIVAWLCDRMSARGVSAIGFGWSQ